MWRHLSTAFTAVLGDDIGRVDGQTTVRVDDHTEQTGVCLLHAQTPLVGFAVDLLEVLYLIWTCEVKAHFHYISAHCVVLR